MANENISLSCEVNKMENILEKLECPFTWNMENITSIDLIYDLTSNSNGDQEQNDDKDQKDDKEYVPYNDVDDLFRLMKHILKAYINTKMKTDSTEIFNELKKCDVDMQGVKKYNHPEISIDVALFILQSTQIFVFKELNLTKELTETLSELKQDWVLNSKETSTLNACRSICWWVCNRIPIFESEKYIRQAIKDNPNCEVWYFILGKNLRRKRRNLHFGSNPSEEEVDSFVKAYNTSKKPAYGIFVAHVYREMRRNKDAEQIYNAIFEQNPIENPTILLRVALGFIYSKSFSKAKDCLDKVEAIQPQRIMFLHYRGIYHLHLQQYEEAAKFLKQACSHRNFGAEKQYLQCALKLDKSFDVVAHLHELLNKYKDYSKDLIQQLLLDLALTYWKKENDVPNSLIYFLKAVETDPEAKCITKYYVSSFTSIRERNVYVLLKQEILPFVLRNKRRFEQSCIDRAETLQKYCEQYFYNNNKNVAKTLNHFRKFNLKTKS